MSSFHVCAHSVLYFLSGVERSIRDTKFMRDDSSENFFNQDDFKRWAMRESLHQYNDFYFTSEIQTPSRLPNKFSSLIASIFEFLLRLRQRLRALLHVSWNGPRSLSGTLSRLSSCQALAGAETEYV